MPPPRLGRLDQRARDLLRLLAVLAEEPVPFSVLAAADKRHAEDGESSRQLAARLAEAGLLGVTETSVALPPAIRTALLRRLSDRSRIAAVRRAAEALAETFPADAHDVRTWPMCKPLEPHVRAVIGQAQELGAEARDAFQLVLRLAQYTLYRGDVRCAHEMLEASVPLGDAQLADDDPLRADLRSALGETLNDLREHDAAQQSMKEALVLHERILGPDSPQSVFDRVGIGIALEGLGDLAGSRSQLDRAVATLGRVSPHSREQLVALKFLAWLMFMQREPAEARARFDEALALAYELFGPAHPETAGVRSMLGAVLVELGESEFAKAELSRAVADLEAALDPDHVNLAVGRSNLSEALRRVGDFDGAKHQLELALAAAKRTLPPNHLAIWMRHSKLGAVLAALGDHDGALAHQEEALRIVERNFGAADPRAVRERAMVAMRRTATGDLAGARTAYEQALDAGAASAHADELPLAEYASDLVKVLRSLGDRSAALAAGLRALELSRAAQNDALAATNRLLVASLGHALQREVSTAYDALDLADRAAAARDMADGALDHLLAEGAQAEDVRVVLAAAKVAIEERRLPRASEAAKHADAMVHATDSEASTRALIDVWRALGRALVETDEWDAAWHAFERELELLRTLPKPVPQAIGVALHDLANVRVGQHRLEEAIALYREAVESKRQADHPEDFAVTLRALGVALARIGHAAEAEEMFQQRLELLRGLPRPDPRQIGITLHDLADIRRTEGRAEEAIALYREAAAQKRAAGHSRDLAGTLQALGRMLDQTGRSAEAEKTYAEQITVLQDMPDPQPRGLGFSFHDLATAKFRQGRVAEGIEDFKRAVEHHRAGGDRRSLVITLHALGRALVDTGSLDEATAIFEERLGVLRALPNPDPQQIGVTLHDLADIRRLQARPEEAVALYEEAAEHKRRGDRPLDLATTLHALALAREALERYDEAAAAYEEELAILEALPEPDLRRRSVVLHDLALLHCVRGLNDVALALAERATEQMRADGDELALATVLHALGVVHAYGGRLEEADAVLQERLTLLQGQPDPEPAAIGVTLHDLADIRDLQERPEEAIALYQQAAAYKRKSRVPNDLAVTLHVLGRGLEALDRHDEAEAAYRERLELLHASPSADSQQFGVTLHDIGNVVRAQGRAEEALASYRQAVEHLRAAGTPRASSALAAALRSLGRTLVVLGRSDEANAVFMEELERRRAEPQPDGPQIGVVLHDLGDIHRQRGQWEEAIALYREAVEHKRHGDHPRDLAVTLDALGHALGAQDRSSEAAAAYEEELAVLRALPDGEPEAVAWALSALADLRVGQQQLDAAIELLREMVEVARAAEPGTLAAALHTLGQTLQLAGRIDEAAATYDEQLALIRHQGDLDPLARGLMLDPIAELWLRHGRGEEALELLREAIEHLRRAGNGPALEYGLHRIGRALKQMGHIEEARLAFEEQLAMLRRGEDADPQGIGVALHDLADVSRMEGRYEVAFAVYETAAQHKRQADDPADLATTLCELADTALVLQRFDAAREAAAEAVELLQEPRQSEGPTLVRALLLQAQATANDSAVTLDLLGRVRHELQHAWAGAMSDARARTIGLVADIYERLGYVEVAQLLRHRARAGLEWREPSSDDLLNASETLASVGRLDEAWDMLTRATPSPGAPADDMTVLSCANGWFVLGRKLAGAYELERSKQALERSLTLCEHLGDSEYEIVTATLHGLGDTLRAQGRTEEAISQYARAVQTVPDDSMEAAIALHARGRAYEALGQYASASSDYEAVASIVETRDTTFEGVVLHDLADVRMAQGRGDEAMELLRSAIARKREPPGGQSLIVTLIAYARAARLAGDRVTAYDAGAEAAQLVRREWLDSIVALNRRDMLLLQPAAPWPSDAAATHEAVELLLALSPQAVALLERRTAAEAAVLPAMADGSAASELCRAGLLTSSASALTAAGHVAAGLLIGQGEPPDTVASALGVGGPSPDQHALILLSRLALESDTNPATLLRDLDPIFEQDAASAEAVAACGVLSLCAPTRRQRSDAQQTVHAAVEALAAAADAQTLLALAIACTDAGDLVRGQALLERAEHRRKRGDREANRVDPAQIGLAWHWVAAHFERAGDLEDALDAYRRSATLMEGLAHTIRAKVLACVVNVLKRLGENDRAREQAAAMPWHMTSDVRDVRVGALLRLARHHVLLEEPLAGRAALAAAAANVRLAQPLPDATDASPPDIDEAATAEILAALSPPTVALLERLRQDEAVAAELSRAPGSMAPHEAAWIVLRSANELRGAGLLRPDVPSGWFTLTPLGRTAAASLLGPANVSGSGAARSG